MGLGITFPFDRNDEGRFAPSYEGNSISNSDRVITVQYGDGYAKYMRDGSNWKKESYSFKWKAVPFVDIAKLEALPSIPSSGDCTNILTEYEVGNILYEFFQNVRTITPFNFQLPKVNRIVQLRCKSIKFEFPTFNTCDITVDMETDFTLE